MFEGGGKSGVNFTALRGMKGGKMEKLKVLLAMGIIISILIFCAFAPGICIDRFMLPDGCGNGCSAAHSPCSGTCVVPDHQEMACR